MQVDLIRNMSYNNYADKRQNRSVSFMGKNKDLSKNEQEFLRYKIQLARKDHEISTKSGIAQWDYYINSSNENMKTYEKEYDKSLKFWSDKKTYKKLLQFEKKGISDKTLKRTITDLIHDFEENVKDTQLQKKLQTMQNKIEQTVNSYKGNFDGKEYPNAELTTILETEKNPGIREKAYNARYVTIGEKIEKDLINLVKERNKFAKKKGYDNYFSYVLKESYKVDEKQLFNTLDIIAKKTRPIYKQIQEEGDIKLAKVFNISPKELQPWHYGLLLEGNPKKEANKYLKDNKMMENTVYDMYKAMGWNVKEMPIMLDLYPKTNKNQHGFCFDLNPNKDARILANLKNDTNSVETLLHEMGHSVYALSYSPKLQYFDKNTHYATTEAVAMMMETVPAREGFYSKELNLPTKLSKKLETYRLKTSIKFVNYYEVLINFEKMMYENPDQDLSKLWFELSHKYELRPMPKKIVNEWANIPHLLVCPGYLQNYFRAEIMQDQMYNAASKKLGKLTENSKTRKFFEKNLFKYGKSLPEDELLEKFTGSKLNVEALCKSYEKLLKVIKK
ncbi:MAG: M2 family metallopeptidase [Clostridiaceae bacterium]|nr:M2 family metallopeptidase [Clostridiaceae bacterium]